tara:strand:+ start:4870 stop:5340 length:471 start_codon:yes stop_codon:yes gene_type:complete
MTNSKSFLLNTRDMKDIYIRDNMELIENKINELIDTSESATSVQESFLCRDALLGLRAVRRYYFDTVKLCDPSATYFDACVYGITLAGNSKNTKTKIVTYGILKDTNLDFSQDEVLYLNTDGSITNVAPSTTYKTIIGYSLGNGEIFINIQPPIEV